MNHAYICDAIRTPIGRYGGALSSVRLALTDLPMALFLAAALFAAERARRERGEKAETTLIGFEASDIAAAELQGTEASVTVRFVSEQIMQSHSAPFPHGAGC